MKDTSMPENRMSEWQSVKNEFPHVPPVVDTSRLRPSIFLRTAPMPPVVNVLSAYVTLPPKGTIR